MIEKEVQKEVAFSWAQVQTAAVVCLEKIKKIQPVEAVVALGRGGAIPAAYIACQLDVPLEYVHYSRKEGYQGSTLTHFSAGSRLLLVDDATETGGSFMAVKQRLPHFCFLTCALFHSEKATYCPDIYGDKYAPCPPHLPWEKNT